MSATSHSRRRSLHVALARERYRVAGATFADAYATIALLGPLRGGRRFAAYTDWEVHWTDLSVLVSVTVTVPERTLAPAASLQDVVAWATFVAQADAHEAEHVAFARRAGEVALEGLERGEDPRAAVDVILIEEREFDRRCYEGIWKGGDHDHGNGHDAREVRSDSRSSAR